MFVYHLLLFFMVHCVAYGCSNQTGSGRSFFRFPDKETRPQLHAKWLSRVNRAEFVPSKYSSLCSDHFEKSCYVKDPDLLVSWGIKVKLRLKSDALPTIFNFSPNRRRGTKKRSNEVGKKSRKYFKVFCSNIKMRNY